MKRLFVLLPFMLSLAWGFEVNNDDWKALLKANQAMESDDNALNQISIEEKRLNAILKTAPTVEAKVQMAELQIMCKIKRVGFMSKGTASSKGISLLEEVVKEQADHLYARFLLGYTCMKMPKFMGKYKLGIKQFEYLYEQGEKNEYVHTYIYLAKAL